MSLKIFIAFNDEEATKDYESYLKFGSGCAFLKEITNNAPQRCMVVGYED